MQQGRACASRECSIFRYEYDFEIRGWTIRKTKTSEPQQKWSTTATAAPSQDTKSVDCGTPDLAPATLSQASDH